MSYLLTMGETTYREHICNKKRRILQFIGKADGGLFYSERFYQFQKDSNTVSAQYNSSQEGNLQCSLYRRECRINKIYGCMDIL